MDINHNIVCVLTKLDINITKKTKQKSNTYMHIKKYNCIKLTQKFLTDKRTYIKLEHGNNTK